MSQDENKKLKRVSINLNCYTIRFRKKGNKDEYLSFKEVFNNELFSSVITKFTNTLSTTVFVNESNDRMIRFEKFQKQGTKVITGVILKGHSGLESYVEELQSQERTTKQIHTIKSDHFNNTPFYFLLSLPDVKSKSIIFMAQSYMQFGYKEIFEDAFLKFFKENYSTDFLCEFGTLSVAKLFNKYVNDGAIRRLRLKRNGLTQQLEDVVNPEEHADSKDFEVELSVKMKRNSKNFLTHFRKIDFQNSSFIETFKVDGFDYTEALVDISAGGRTRVLNFSKPEEFAASYDVTDKSSLDKHTRHPDFGKLDEEAIAILEEEIIPSLGL